MKEYRRATMSDLRALAIQENWFTLANNEEYGAWLTLATDSDNIDTNLIVELAEMVRTYSELDGDCELSSVCYLVATATYTVFYE